MPERSRGGSGDESNGSGAAAFEAGRAADRSVEVWTRRGTSSEVLAVGFIVVVEEVVVIERAV